MIYITGDCHSNFERFNTRNFPEQKEMTKDDYVIDRISWPGKKEKPFVFESWENQDYSKVVHAIKKYIENREKRDSVKILEELVIHHRLYDACFLEVFSMKDTVGFFDMNSTVTYE